MSPLPLIALSMSVGFVFGWATCLWFGLPKRSKAIESEPNTEPGLRQCVAEHAPMPPAVVHSFYRSTCGGPPKRIDLHPAFVHDCLALGCKTAHGDRAPEPVESMKGGIR